MAADITGDREMISEKVAPTLVGRVLTSFDLVVIFVALVLFIPNASTVQFAGPATRILDVPYPGSLCHGAAWTYVPRGRLAVRVDP